MEAVYIDAVMRGEIGDGSKISGAGGEGDYLASFMQMTWFCVEKQ